MFRPCGLGLDDVNPERYTHLAGICCSTPGQLDSVLTTGLHGLALALRQGVPVLAVDGGRRGQSHCPGRLLELARAGHFWRGVARC